MLFNNNHQYHLLFVSLSHRRPTTLTVHARARMPVELIRTPICGYHYLNRGETK